ncbi:hypothetical protein ABT150_52350 [Streptomyces mirabilis]|uniref:hypothetical protein n=1 Tax=Streptomyces mirabilis TaxID=68239 RepID=UPI0033285DBF
MELVHPLDDLDSYPWSSFSHAYGSAEDLPDLLRALADSDAGAAGEALSELYGSVLHQGTVYAASAEVAPFLARIAVAGHQVADVLMLLGGMAESEDEHGVTSGTVRAAVAGQLPLLLPLLDAAEPEVRRTAVWAVSHTGATALVLPALRRRWEEEAEPLVRAEVLSGISRLDPSTGAVAAATVWDMSQPAGIRMAALFACLDAGLPWTEAHHTTMLSLLPAEPLGGDCLDLERSEPFTAVVEALPPRGPGGGVRAGRRGPARRPGRSAGRGRLDGRPRLHALPRRATAVAGRPARGGRRRGGRGRDGVAAGPSGHRRRSGRGRTGPARRREPEPDR